MSNIGIIGTAGRNGDGQRLNKKVYNKVIENIKDFISEKKINVDDLTLVSGGSSWMDHTAVTLFLSNAYPNMKLTLHVPCEYDSINKEFADTKKVDWITNPGGTLNYYHRLFSKTSLNEIDLAIKKGAKIVISKGMMSRNKSVSDDVKFLLAFTFGDGDVPKDGGTKKTWDYAKKIGIECRHIPLGNILDV